MIWEALRSLLSDRLDRHDDPPPDDAPRPRQLVLFCDGTGNSITGGARDTNVLKLYQSLLDVAADRDDLLLYYDPGVGSPDQLPATGIGDQIHRTWERIVGLAEGAGIFQNVSEGYAFLMRNYRPQDRVFIFGFSRGAFTARAIAGLVQLVGIMNEDAEQLLPLLARVYFSSTGQAATKSASAKAMGKLKSQLGATVVTREALAAQIKRDFTTGARQDASVHFLGVWDTVDSVGLPGLSKRITSLPTARDKRAFVHVRQALALDEHRMAFKPRVYSDPDYDVPDPDRPGGRKSLKQRWFAGAHSDVGGGYPDADAGLSSDALRWILDEAFAEGLGHPAARSPTDQAADGVRLEQRVMVRSRAVVHGGRVRHDEVLETPWWALAGMTLREPGPVGMGLPSPYEVPSTAFPRVDLRRALYTLVFALAAMWGLQTALGGAGVAGLFDFAKNLGALRDYGLRHVALLRLDFGAAAADCCTHGAWTRPASAPWRFWTDLSAGADFAWALVWDFLSALALGYLLAIVMGRAFVRWAGAAVPGTHPSGWKIVGIAPALAILVWCLKDLAWLLALLVGALGVKALAGLLFVAGVVALFVALLGWAGCGVLLLMGLARRPQAWKPGPAGA